MMATSAIAGACPKCGSTNTEIIVRSGDETVAHGICHGCGFEDMRLRGDDSDMVIEQARRSFSTVYISDGDNVDGLPSVDVLAHDMALLMKIICSRSDSCETCPLHAKYDEEPEDFVDEGYFVVNSALGFSCVAQDRVSCSKRLMKLFPGLPLD